MSSFNVVDVINSKSKGLTLSSEDIHNFVECVHKNLIDEAQIGAFLMAVKLKSMNAREVADLTRAMTHFSEKFDWSNFQWRNRVVDKHSTGGVGDKISHILAPLLAACGLKIPMISGRCLGITGGTIDKLESIAGFRLIDDQNIMPSILENVGFFITGQTSNMIPVDKRIYAIRDITATTDSIPLITASILSKKKVEDLNLLLMDIKYGKGAFMKTENDAVELGKMMIETGKSLNMNIVCLIDDMNTPIGHCIGNALEIAETLRCLNGVMLPDIKELVYIMATEILKFTEISLTSDEIIKMLDEAINSGAALEKFKLMLIAQGVTKNLVDKLCVHKILSVEDYLGILNHKSSKITEIPSRLEGFVHHIDAETFGIVTRDLGAGRLRKDDIINFSVGIELFCKEGDFIKKGDLWCKVYHDSELACSVVEYLQSALVVKSDIPIKFKRIKDIFKSN